jgi:hypothetical protein
LFVSACPNNCKVVGLLLLELLLLPPTPLWPLLPPPSALLLALVELEAPFNRPALVAVRTLPRAKAEADAEPTSPPLPCPCAWWCALGEAGFAPCSMAQWLLTLWGEEGAESRLLTACVLFEDCTGLDTRRAMISFSARVSHGADLGLCGNNLRVATYAQYSKSLHA